jgi:hypothetical protein
VKKDWSDICSEGFIGYKYCIQEARKIVTNILSLLWIAPVDRGTLEMALASMMLDFEDAVQLSCASQQQLDAIVTRNSQDFQASLLPILSIEQLFDRSLH